MYNDTTQDLMLRELQPGERLLWSGQPRQGLMFRQADVFLIPFSLVWCGFVVFWETMVISMAIKPSHDPASMWVGLGMAAFGLPFVAVGVMLLFGRFFLDIRRRAHTHYGVTDSRLLIISGTRARRTVSKPLAELPELTISERPDGTGDISLGYLGLVGVQSGQQVAVGLAPGMPNGLEGVQDVRTVYRLILEASRAA